MDNKEKKLTGMAGNSYHGSMDDKFEKPPVNNDSSRETVKDGKIPVENKGTGGKSEKSREAFNWKNLTEVEKQEYFEKMEKMTQESEKGKEPGLFDILMDILKAWFGVEDDEKAKDIIKNSEAMRGLSAYLRIKPQNKWGATDYMRVFCMLAPDTSEASIRLKSKLESDAKENGIKTDDMNNAGIKIREEHPEFFSKKDEDRNEQERRAEMMHRAVAMNMELQVEAAEKEFQEREKEVNELLDGFDPRNKKIVENALDQCDPDFIERVLKSFKKRGGDPAFLKKANDILLRYSKKATKEGSSGTSKNAEAVTNLMRKALSDLGVDDPSIDSRSGESESRKNVRGIMDRESKQGDQGKKAKESDVKMEEQESGESEAMRGFRTYLTLRPGSKWEASDYATALLMLELDISPETMAIQSSIVAKVNEKGIGQKVSDMKRIYMGAHPEFTDKSEDVSEDMAHRAIVMNYDLWNDIEHKRELSNLSTEQLDEFENGIESLLPKGKHTQLDNQKRELLLARSKKARSRMEEAKEESDESREKGTEEKKKKKKPKNMRKTAEDFYEIFEESKEKLGEISENTLNMLAELKMINDKLDELIGVNGTIMQAMIDDPETAKRYQNKYQNQVGPMLARYRNLEANLDEKSGGEKVVLGKERDKELYSGNIDQMLEARMRRIEFFHEMRKMDGNNSVIDPNIDPNGESKWGDLKNVGFTSKDLLLDPDESYIGDDERIRRLKIREKNFRIQTKKAYEDFKEEGTLKKHEDLYFKELQRWVGTILKNSEFGYEKQKGDLKLPREVHIKFRKLRDKLDPSAADFEDKLIGAVRDLRSEKFLDYFKGVDPNKRAMFDQYQYPTSLEATMLLIAENKGTEWQTGGKYELIDAEGKFHRENFILWMRKEINLLIDWDPITAINAQGGITFKAGFSQISLFEILYMPQYTRHQEFKMSGDVGSWYGKGKKGNFQNGWGQAEEHPDMKYDVRVNAANTIGILEEAWDNDHEHKDAAALNNDVAWSSAGEWVKARGPISAYNNYVRAGLAFKRYMLGSHKGDEIKDYYEHGKQGSVGKAIAAGHLFFRYFSDWTENYAVKDSDEEKNSEKVIEVDRDNQVYKALGHNGGSFFLQSLAESAFDHVDSTAREKIKGAYRDFIVRRAEEMKNEYGNLDGEKKKDMEFLVENFVNDLKGEDLDKIKIRLDSSKELTDLKMNIESKVLRNRIVSAEDKEKYGWKEKVVVREEVEKKIGGEMRRNIKEFFEGFKNSEGKHIEGVLEQQIPYVPDDKDGLLKGKIRIDPTTGKQVLVTIGASRAEAERLLKEKEIDIFVYTDANGRIVKKNEWDKMDAANQKKTTVGDIVRDFYEHFEEDQNDLAGYEKDFKPIYTEYERAKKEYDLAVANKSTDVEAKKQAMDNIRDGDGFKKYDDILKRNESLGLALLTKVGNISRDELNMFKRSRTLGNASTADVLIKGALTKSLTKVYGLDEEIEGVYAFHRIWYPLSYMGIAGINNTSGFSGAVQPEAEYTNFRKRRISRYDLGTGGGSKGTLDAFGALIPGTFLEWTRWKKKGEGKSEHMLIEALQRGGGRDMKPYFMRDLEDNASVKYEIATKSESAFHEDGLKKAEEVRKLIIDDHELKLEKIVYTDIWGAQRINHEDAIKIFGTWWDNIRQLFNNHGIDFESKIAIHGREVTMMEYMFGEEIYETVGRMKSYYNEHAEKLEKKGKTEEAEAYKSLADQLKSKPALAAFLFLVTTSIHEHREKWGTYDQWSAGTIQDIWVVMDEYLHQKSGLEWKNKIKERPSMIPYELFDRLLGVHKSRSWLFGETEDSMEGHMFWDLFYCLVGGFVAGLSEARKEIEDELTGQPKKQWVG